MPSPRSLLALYPRAWRERYADEFLDACGDEPLRFQQVIDIVSGAIDAHFAPQSHLAANAGRHPEGVSMSVNLRALCSRPPVRYTTADGLKGAPAMIISSLVFLGVGIVCNRSGWHTAGEFFKGVSFPISFLLMSYTTFMKGQPRIAKLVILGGTASFLVIISAVAAWL